MSEFIHKFGLDWPEGTPEHQMHLMCSRFGPHLEPYKSCMEGTSEWHLQRAIELLFEPHQFKMNPWAEKLLWAWCNHNLVVVMGPAAANKSHTMGLLAVMDWVIAPRVTSTFLASTTKSALEKRSWSSVLQYFQILKSKGCDGVISKSRTAIINDDDAKQDGEGYDVKSGVFGVAVLAGTLQDALSNLIGVHHPEPTGGVRLIADEAQAIKQAFIDARFNLMIGTPDVRTVLLGNPMSFEDPLGDLATPLEGWDSVTIDSEEWENKSGGVTIHFDGEKSPAIEEPEEYPFLINKTQIDQVLAANNGDTLSRKYLTMCRGWIAQDSDVHLFLPRTFITRFRMEEEPVWEGEFEVVAGVDPAFSSGGDQAILQLAFVGYTVDRTLTVGFGPTIPLVIRDQEDAPIMYQICDQIKIAGASYGFTPATLAVDETGTQRLSDVIDMEWAPGVLRKSFGTKPSDMAISVYDDTPCSKAYKDTVTELWHTMQTFGQFSQIRGLPSQAAKEFSMRRGVPGKSPLRLEPKEEMKKRLRHSPDTADACVLCLAVARERLGVHPGATKHEPLGKAFENFSPSLLQKYNSDVRKDAYLKSGF